MLHRISLSDIIETADEKLSGPAGDAISLFVGYPYRGTSPLSGLMLAKPLEDAFSAVPSRRGMIVREALTEAFQPVRDALEERYGASIPLYRAQSPVLPLPPGTVNFSAKAGIRNVLSWTLDLAVAESFRRDDGAILAMAIPVDAIVWITNRTGHQEAIVRNIPGSPWFIDQTGRCLGS